MIKDSGNRMTYTTGAVRDMKEGKGRMDLIPLEQLSRVMNTEEALDTFVSLLASYKDCGDVDYLEEAYIQFVMQAYGSDFATATIELSKHFEEGAKKYGEYNWQKGIPEWSYLDSALRHYMKWLRGDMDEPHDRAVLWNLICLMWTHENILDSKDLMRVGDGLDYVDPAWKYEGDM